jgi:hypothetical protein
MYGYPQYRPPLFFPLPPPEYTNSPAALNARRLYIQFTQRLHNFKNQEACVPFYPLHIKLFNDEVTWNFIPDHKFLPVIGRD